MTKNEMVQIMAVISAAYPRFYDKQTEADKIAALRLWYRHFEYVDYDVMLKAVDAIISKNKFPPAIAEIYEKLNIVLGVYDMTETEAWSFVLKIIRGGQTDYQRKFELLPPIIQDTLGSADKLKEWSEFNDIAIDVIISNEFQQAFSAEIERRRRLMELPDKHREYLKRQQKYICQNKLKCIV